MDDFAVMGDTFEEALHNLEKILHRCRETNLSLSNEKCSMIMTDGIVLGLHVFVAGNKVDPEKIEVIEKLPPPTSQKGVQSFLGNSRYYRIFVENFTKVASPLFKLLTKEYEFHWNDECQATFDTFKEMLSSTPVLRGTDWKLPFHISTNDSDSTIGVVLGQKEDLVTHAIYYVSKNLTLAELNYTVIEKEFLDVIYVINKFRNYITGYEVFVHTKHSVVRYLMNKPDTNGRITRWLLLLREFDITVLDRLGKENQVADFLSRLNHVGEDVIVNDSFHDKKNCYFCQNTLVYR